ncbi:MAG TPA: hypothetical protein VG144_02630 [Gaiellaceae bacterium]|nr:hypothetical protein [Gaiellaceae bacterium]
MPWRRGGPSAAAQRKPQPARDGGVLGASTSLRGAAARTRDAATGALSDPYVLSAVGLLTLLSAALGGLVLYRLRREHLLR